MKYLLTSLILVGGSLCVNSCQEETVKRVQYGGAEEYVPVYNAEINDWLERELAKKSSELIKAQSKADDAPQNVKLKGKVTDLKREIAKLKFRVAHGDYFKLLKEENLPKDLNWTSGEKQPVVGDSNAKKGGVFRNYIPSFPSTLRMFGPESNSTFRGKLYDELSISLVGAHPVTGKDIPGVADKWALSKDGKTVYFHIDPKATFSDGVKVTSKDFLTYIYIRISPFVVDPYYKQYFKEQFAGMSIYGDNYVAITLPEQKPKIVQTAGISPAPTHFYKNYGPDFAKHYQWKVQPTTGAYLVKDEGVVKGVSVTLTRDKDWWAKDKRYYRYRFNPDKISYQVIGDAKKAFELFRSGKLDYFEITSPKYWFEESEIEPVFDGYIERRKFFNQYPRIPRGLYLNVSRGLLKDKNIRLGLQYAINFQKIIDVVFRGEFARLQSFSQGFGEFTNKNLKAREYSVLKAKEYFAKAGFTELGDDGVLRRKDGTKLSIGLTYGNSAGMKTMVSILKEFGLKAGVDIRLDGLERTVSYQKVMKKQHEMTFWGWGSNPPYPRYFQFFHSSNAFDEKGAPKPSTNNINCYASDEMDKLVESLQNARTEAEVKEYALKTQQLLWDESLFIPGYLTNYVCVANWRWLRWPNAPKMKFGTPVSRDPMEDYLFWIDDDIKKETMAAKRQGKTFPEIQEVNDTFKDGIPKEYLTPAE